MTVSDILQDIVLPLSRGSYLLSERPALEGVHAYLCAKEIHELINNSQLFLELEIIPKFDKHPSGVKLVTDWAAGNNLNYHKEVDISVGIADVIVYADDVGFFEIGTTRPTKIILLLKYISRMNHCYTVHFWPYSHNRAFIFKNWHFNT